MKLTIRATFDGKVFRPEEPLSLPPNTEVVLHVSAKVDRKWPTLKERLARITKDNIHPEWDIGPPMGNEVW
jgi:antitoxin component of MazEF toxin-antitoxin module